MAACESSDIQPFGFRPPKRGRIPRRAISCTALQNALKFSIRTPFFSHECSSENETGQPLAIGGKTYISSGAVFSGFTQTRSVISRFSHEGGNTQVGPLYFVFLRRHVRTVTLVPFLRRRQLRRLGFGPVEVQVLGFVNDAHAAAAQLFNNLVVRYGLFDHWREILRASGSQVNEGLGVDDGSSW